MSKMNSKHSFSDENDLPDFANDDDFDEEDSEEGTDDASEGEETASLDFPQRHELGKTVDIKEQMYQVKLAQLKKQLTQLKDGTLPEYQKKLRRVEINYKDRLSACAVFEKEEMKRLEEEYIIEQKAAILDFDNKKVELMQNLERDLDKKLKDIEADRVSMDLNTEALEMKPANTRKLRRRVNDPNPSSSLLPDKKRKSSPDLLSQMSFVLNEQDIQDDLNIISKITGKTFQPRKPQLSLPVASPTNTDNIYEVKIDDGRLFHEKKWYHRGQAVYVEGKDIGKVSAVITAVGTAEIWLRRTIDNSKLPVTIGDLQKGKYLIKKRGSS